MMYIRCCLLRKTSTSIATILILTTQVLITRAFKENVMNVNLTTSSQLLDEPIKKTFECEEYKIRICILELERNKIDLAVIMFNKLQNTNDSLQRIINQVYAENVNNLHKLLKFITKLLQCNHRYIGLEYLFNTLRHNNNWKSQDSFQFAYHLKALFDETTCLHENENSNLKEKLIYLKYKIPEGIRTIIWQQSKLCLKNTFNKEHLYIPACCNYDGERRRLFSWIPKGEIGPQGEFTFEPIKDASLFRIKSDYYQEHLYAADCCKYDTDRRNVFTWIPKGDIGPQGEWTLELVNESNLFRIKNNHYNEYLYAAHCCYYDKDRRSIFTWIPKGDIGIQGEWEISTC